MMMRVTGTIATFLTLLPQSLPALKRLCPGSRRLLPRPTFTFGHHPRYFKNGKATRVDPLFAKKCVERNCDVSDDYLSGSDSDCYSPGNDSDSDVSVDAGSDVSVDARKAKKTKAGKEVLQASSSAGKRQRQASSSDEEVEAAPVPKKLRVRKGRKAKKAKPLVMNLTGLLPCPLRPPCSRTH